MTLMQLYKRNTSLIIQSESNLRPFNGKQLDFIVRPPILFYIKMDIFMCVDVIFNLLESAV